MAQIMFGNHTGRSGLNRHFHYIGIKQHPSFIVCWEENESLSTSFDNTEHIKTVEEAYWRLKSHPASSDGTN